MNLKAAHPVLRRNRVPDDVRDRYTDDRQSAERYGEVLDRARAAERRLVTAQNDRRPYAEIRQAMHELQDVLAEALAVAEAGQRAALGPAAYTDRIAARKALAKPAGRWWTDEVDRLRTLRERYRLEAMRRTGTLVPSHVRVGTHAASGPHIAGVDMAEAAEGKPSTGGPRIGVDLRERTARER